MNFTAPYPRLSLLTNLGGELLSVIAELCLRTQKTSPLWLASATSVSTSLPATLFFFLLPLFPAGPALSTPLFKLQLTSNPA